MYLPIGLFGISIATAALPYIARHAARDDLAAVRETISRGLRMMLMLNVPATVGLMVLARPIVALLLQRGRFTALDTAATAAALVWYAPGLLAYSVVKIASPTFYSLRDSRTPVLVSVASVLANLIVNLALVGMFGFRGLAAGTALAATFNAGTLLWLLRRRLSGIDETRIAVTLAKILCASLVMGIVAHVTVTWLAGSFPGVSTAARGVHVFGGIGAGVLALLAASRALRIEEFDQAVGFVLRRRRIEPDAAA
jgi:putative peptidoglycan lipid II flippase